MIRKLALIGVVLLVAFANAHVASAQIMASITGTVTDTSGSGMPAVDLTATNLETGVVRTARTDAEGSYRILSLPVGRYEVKAVKPGFRSRQQTGIDLVVGQQAVVNLSLEIGDVQQSVTVTRS